MSQVDQKVDLIVIGGGVLGAFHAFHAIEMNLNVILLERSDRPSGASVRNFGQIVPSGLNRDWRPLGRRSLEIYKSLQQKIDLTVRQLGSVYLASDDDEVRLIQELHEINAAEGYRSEMLTQSQCLDRYPQLRGDYCRAGLFFPEEISVNPRTMLHKLHEYLASHDNFRSHFNAQVKEIESSSDHDVKVTSSDGRVFSASKVVLCCGHEFLTLFPEKFLSGQLELVKLQMVRLCAAEQPLIHGNILTGLSIRRYESFSQCPSWEEIKSREPSDSLAKKWGVHILFKQEADGSIILGDSHEYASVNEASKLDFGLRADINRFFIEEAKKIFDLSNWEVESSWCGFYSQTSCASGIYRETIDGAIHVVTGIGGKGMTSSAGFAEKNLGEILQ